MIMEIVIMTGGPIAMTSVTLFGAIGDSIHDDSAALQRALDADESHLYIPAGKYRIHGDRKSVV